MKSIDNTLVEVGAYLILVFLDILQSLTFNFCILIDDILVTEAAKEPKVGARILGIDRSNLKAIGIKLECGDMLLASIPLFLHYISLWIHLLRIITLGSLDGGNNVFVMILVILDNNLHYSSRIGYMLVLEISFECPTILATRMQKNVLQWIKNSEILIDPMQTTIRSLDDEVSTVSCSILIWQ